MRANTTLVTARILAALLATVMIAAACGGGDDDSAEGDDAAPADGGTDAADGGDGTADGGDAADSTDGAPDEDDDADGADGTDGIDGDGAAGGEPAGEPEPTNGFDGETIRLGYLTDQSGSLSIVGNPLLRGAEAYWEAVNADGGVAGRYPVELVPGDTMDQEGATVQEYQRIKDDVVMFAEVLSTPPTQAVLEFLDEDNILAVPGSLALQWASEPQLVPQGTAYEYEMINLADWYVNESGLAQPDDVYCSIAFDDKYGQDTIRGVNHAADELGIELAVSETVGRGATSFTAQVSAMEDCTVVFAITVATEQLGIMSEAGAQGLDPVWLGALPSYINLFGIANPDLYEKFHVALDPPNFDRTDVPGMVRFLDVWESFGEGEPNTFHLSGYFQSIAIEALLEKAIELGDLSRDGMADALAQLGEVDTEGLTDTYVYGTPENRVPASASRIFVFDPTVPPNFVRELAQVDSPLIETFDPS